MSRYYGVIGNERAKRSTRCGHRELWTQAASWEGAVQVVISEGPNGKEWARVELIPWYGKGVQKELYFGPVDGCEA